MMRLAVFLSIGATEGSIDDDFGSDIDECAEVEVWFRDAAFWAGKGSGEGFGDDARAWF